MERRPREYRRLVWGWRCVRWLWTPCSRFLTLRGYLFFSPISHLLWILRPCWQVGWGGEGLRKRQGFQTCLPAARVSPPPFYLECLELWHEVTRGWEAGQGWPSSYLLLSTQVTLDWLSPSCCHLQPQTQWLVPLQPAISLFTGWLFGEEIA